MMPYGSPQRTDPTSIHEGEINDAVVEHQRFLEDDLGDVLNRPLGSHVVPLADRLADYMTMRNDPEQLEVQFDRLVGGGMSEEQAAIAFAKWVLEMEQHMSNQIRGVIDAQPYIA